MTTSVTSRVAPPDEARFRPNRRPMSAPGGRHHQAHARPSYPDPAGGRRRRRIGDLIGSAAVAGLAAVLVLWLHDGGIQGFAGPGGVATELGRVSGLVASYLLLLQVLMMARIPWVEGIWGQDVLARRHRLVGFGSFYLMLVHVVAITIGYAQAVDNGLLRQAWLLVTAYPGMLLATAGTVALIVVVVLSIRAARRRMRYESWHLIHLYAYLGVGLALPHQLWTGADFTASGLATVFWWGLWAAAAGSIGWWRVGLPLFRSWRHALVVDGVVRENATVVSVYLRGRELDRLGLRAGQFCQWRFLGAPGWTRAHPFTVSAVPTATSVRLTVQETGDWTNGLARVRPGSRVLIEGPYGTMAAHRRTHRDVLLLAAGVGLTTMRGLAEEILAEGPGDGPGGRRRPSVIVLHRIRDRSQALFADELNALSRNADLRAFGLLGRRSPDSGWWGGAVPVNPAAALRRAVPDIGRREIYLCGPGEWMRAVRRSLRELGVRDEQMHAEEFAW